MTEVGSANPETEDETTQEADYGAPAEAGGQDDHEADLANNVGLAELRAMDSAYRALGSLDKNGRIRAFKWLAEALHVPAYAQTPQSAASTTDQMQYSNAAPQSQAISVTPREFISQKKPESLVERVACLAYYLTRYRGMNHFKTADIVALNTEAAAHKFGNPSRDVDNADRHNGYLVSAGSGKKQLTVRGEAVVEALPDRESVRAALKDHPHKARRSPGFAKKSNTRATES